MLTFYSFKTNTPVLTLLPGPVENLDIFKLHPNTSPQRHGVRGVVLAASLYGSISMGPGSEQTE